MTAADPDQAGDPTAKPASLEWIFRATVVWAAFTVISAAVLWWNKSYVRDSLTRTNDAATGSAKRTYTAASLDAAVRTAVLAQIVIAVISGFVLVALAVFLRRGRPWARWVLLAFAAVLAVVGFPLGILGQLLPALAGSNAPVVYRLALGIAGLASLAVIVFCFWPDTRRYFASQRGLTLEAGGRAGQGGMLGMLMGRRAAPPPEDTSVTRTAWRPPPRERIEPSSDPGTSSSAASGADPSSPTAADSDAPAARPAKPRTATRPGSVRPKGGARSKSRQR